MIRFDALMFRTTMLVGLVLACQCARAGSSGDLPMQRRAAVVDEQGDMSPATLPAGIRVVRDVAYGSDANQRFDVYVSTPLKSVPR